MVFAWAFNWKSFYETTLWFCSSRLFTRTNVVYVVHVIFQFMHAPLTTHTHAVKHSFRYLQGTQLHGLFLRPSTSPSLIVAYSNADWDGCKDFCRSTTCYAICFGHNLIAWHSKKQPTISKSSTEIEYRAPGCIVTEPFSIWKLLYDLGIILRDPIQLYCDNIHLYVC